MRRENCITPASPAKAPDRHVSVVVLEIAGKPRMDQGILQNPDGRIQLDAHSAEIQEAKTGTSLEKGRFGTIERWRSTGHRVSWDVKVAEPGEFDVVVLTQTEHSGRWERGHRMKLSAGRQSASGSLKDEGRLDNPRANAFLLDVVSTLGRIKIAKAGTHTVTLRVEKLAKGMKIGPKVREVHLLPAR